VIYVTQYGAWWRLTIEQWRAVCEAGASGQGYDLPDDAQLTRKPRGVHGGREDESDRLDVKISYWTDNNKHPVFQPLDWDPEDFKAALAALDGTPK